MVGNDAILAVLQEHGHDLDTVARELIALANKGGGEDNITVVAFDIAADDEAEADEPTTAVAVPVRPQQPDPDEEDTLSGIERVPAVQTMVLAPEDIPRDEPQAFFTEPVPPPAHEHDPAPGRRGVLVGAALLVAAAVVAAVLWVVLS
jgi:hypothetical protein